MSKDPAFLFYSSDFLTGTMFMSHEQVGIYVRLLCAQHQHGGLIDKISFNSMVGNNHVIRTKFVEVEEGFYNERLMAEMDKRKAKSCNLSANALLRWSKQKQKQCKSNAIALQGDMPPEDENEREDEDINKDLNNKEYVFLKESRFKELWVAFLDMRKSIKAKPTPKAIDLLLKKLHTQTLNIACEMLEHSIENNWKGVFPPKGGKNEKRSSVVDSWAKKRGISLTGNVRQGDQDNRGALPEPPIDRGKVDDLGGDVGRFDGRTIHTGNKKLLPSA